MSLLHCNKTKSSVIWVMLVTLSLVLFGCGGGGGGGETSLVITASPAGGTYGSAQTVSLSGNANSTIYYSVDGSTPTTSSSVYSAVLTISQTSTLKFFGVDDDGNASAVVTEIYDITTAGVGTTVSIESGSERDMSDSLSTRSVGASGGTVVISDGASPLNGLEIDVSNGAANEEINFSVSLAGVVSVTGLPESTAVRSGLINITATGSDEWNTYAMFDKAVRVTLPYDNSSDDIVSFYVLNEDGSLEPVGLESQDETAGTITFLTRTFSNSADDNVSVNTSSVRAATRAASATFLGYIAVGIASQKWADWTNFGMDVNTGFTAANNGWYIPNYGAFYKSSRGGNCMGMVGFAKYYYKKQHSPKFYSNYRDAENTSTWLDDDIAIQLASRVHNGMSDIWNQFVSGELNEQTPSSLAVARSLVGAMYVTGHPALLYILQALNVDGTTQFSGAHAIMVYRADIDASGNITFYVYDPNHPNSDSRRIVYTSGTGFASYLSGTTAAASTYSYNYLKHFGYNVGMSDAALEALKKSADAGFSDDTVFPTITITSITGKDSFEDVMANTGVTDEGQDKYITSDTAVVISGTVLGGLAQTAGSLVDNLNILTPGGNYKTPVNNQAGSGDGTFSITVPIQQGENMVVMLASASLSYSHWAGFDMSIIESTASPAALAVTLNWGQGASDVDLYVKEPNGESGKMGDTVYYQNRRSSGGGYPYLDFDNTTGFGPEHYIADNGDVTQYADGTNATSLYGDYTVKVHYYADHDLDTENIQPISWTVNWRYLGFCADPCTDPEATGIWFEGTQGGQLGAASSSTCCDINNSGATWSSSFNINYTAPDPDDYVIPEPADVMLP